MKKSVKFGIVALAMAASTSAFAANADVEIENEYEAIGWTPFALSLASPVQIPWGSHTWDVFGLDLGIIWADNPKMYGLGVSGIAMATRDDMMGLQVSGFCNWATKDVIGMRATLGANITFGTTYGFDAGAFGYRAGDFWGLDCEFLGNYQKNLWGVGIGGLINLCSEQSYGCTIGVGGNMAKLAYGCQIGGIFNFAEELHGAQIGVVNFAKECPWGFQIGIVNIIMENVIPVLPIVNASF